MIVSDRERAVLIRDLCARLGTWADGKVYQPFSDSVMKAIREDANRLVDLLDARDLSFYRRTYSAYPNNSSEEG